MALSAKRKALLATMDIPSEDVMRQRIRDFLMGSGMQSIEFAEQIGYSSAAVSQFVRGNYNPLKPMEQNSLALRAAAKQYMDLHEIAENYTFRGTQHVTQAYRDVRASALNALDIGAAYLVDGPPGTEKTHTLRQIEREINEGRLGRAIYVYARVEHSPLSFLVECCVAAGIPSRGHIDALIRKLRFFLSGDRILFIVDEAQHLDRKGLEVLRQLLDLPPHFGVILAGSHDLTQRLSHWQMEQWRSRLRKTHYLNGPSKEEAATILRAELGDLSDSQCAEFTSRCMATGQRLQEREGKKVPEKFSYISARDLFNAIEGIKQAQQRKEGVA